eukprot:7505420-Pyramimonas_sp.AAC.1
MPRGSPRLIQGPAWRGVREAVPAGVLVAPLVPDAVEVLPELSLEALHPGCMAQWLSSPMGQRSTSFRGASYMYQPLSGSVRSLGEAALGPEVARPSGPGLW